MSLIIDFPWYFVILCLLLGATYSALLYWISFSRRRKSGEEPFSRGETIGLTLLRAFAVTLIAFLFLAPLVKRQISRKEKPIVVIAQDNSKSLNLCSDSAYYHTGFQDDLDKLKSRLSKDYEVVSYAYGGAVRPLPDPDVELFGDDMTDMGQLVKEISDRYYHRNIGALIVSGDGIYNQGVNPIGVAASAQFPVYTVAMGDTAVKRDAYIANVRFNRIAYLGNNFPVDVTVNATKLKGERSTLTVSLDGRTLFSKPIVFDNDYYSATESITLDADRPGVHNYLVEIVPVNDEKNLRNNRRAIPIEIIDGHQKIAIIAAAPHPDVAALRAAIQQDQNFEVEVFMVNEFSKNPKDYNLLVFHQLPSKIAETNIDVATLLKSGVSALFVLGSQTDLARLNALHAGLEVFSRIDRQNEVTALVNREFTFFSLDDETANRITQFPPLLSPFGEYKLSGNAQTLFTAKVGSVNSRMPLIAMTQQQEHRICFITGEGLWRWRLADWLNNQSHSNFDKLIEKLVVFTALRVNKEKFHVEMKHLFGQSESVTIEAQLYNDNYELVNTSDVDLLIWQHSDRSSGKKYLFNRSAAGYSINLGVLPSGSYDYSASTHFNGKSFSASGSFLVEELNLEALNTVADHSLLNTLATTTGGEIVQARQLDKIPDLLKNRDDMKTVIYSETRYSDMLNVPFIFILIILLLAVEWVVRKYNGEV